MLTGELGLAHAIHRLRAHLGLGEPMLGEIKTACHPKQVERLFGWLEPGSPLIGDNQAISSTSTHG